MIFKRAMKILAIIFVFITIVTPLFSQRKFDIQGTGKQILDGEIIYLSYRNEGRYCWIPHLLRIIVLSLKEL